MACLKKTVLMGPELFELRFEKLVLLIGDGLFVQNQNIRNVILMYL